MPVLRQTTGGAFYEMRPENTPEAVAQRSKYLRLRKVWYDRGYWSAEDRLSADNAQAYYDEHLSNFRQDLFWLGWHDACIMSGATGI